MTYRLASVAALIAILSAGSAQAAAPKEASFTWFAGTWTCVHKADDGDQTSTWTFAQPDAGNWFRLSYGVHGTTGGNAVVGYLPVLRQWVYDDYHADGSYARETSAGFQDGKWTWSGTYYPPQGAASIDGRVDWVVRGHDNFEMFFYPSRSSKAPSGSQSCTRGQ